MSDKTGLKPWSVFWMGGRGFESRSHGETKTGVVWADCRKCARSVAQKHVGTVDAVTTEPQEGGYNIAYDAPEDREHYLEGGISIDVDAATCSDRGVSG